MNVIKMSFGEKSFGEMTLRVRKSRSIEQNGNHFHFHRRRKIARDEMAWLGDPKDKQTIFLNVTHYCSI